MADCLTREPLAVNMMAQKSPILVVARPIGEAAPRPTAVDLGHLRWEVPRSFTPGCPACARRRSPRQRRLARGSGTVAARPTCHSTAATVAARRTTTRATTRATTRNATRNAGVTHAWYPGK